MMIEYEDFIEATEKPIHKITNISKIIDNLQIPNGLITSIQPPSTEFIKVSYDVSLLVIIKQIIAEHRGKQW